MFTIVVGWEATQEEAMDDADDIPIVLETGLLRFRPDGALEIHLDHAPGDPHPLATHPDGQRTTLPPEVSAAELTGSQEGLGAVRGASRRGGDVPDGFVLTVRGWSYVQWEGSGDVSILVRSPTARPSWMSPGKVHRFARAGAPAPALHPGSAPPPEPESERAAPRWTPPKEKPAPVSAPPPAARVGCALLALPFVSVLLLLLVAGCPEQPPPGLVPDDDDSAAGDDDSGDDDDTTDDDDSGDDDVADDDDSEDDDDSGDDDSGDDDSGDDDDSTPPLSLGELCFPQIFDPLVPGPDYEQYSLTVGSHCFGTNHQAVTGIERVVFVGDSVTVGVPNLFLDLAAWGLPQGAGTPDAAFYRNVLAASLATEFGIEAPGPLWGAVNILDGLALVQESGDFASCAKWGARNDDILLPPQQQLEVCLPAAERTKNTLLIMTSGSNDLANMTGNAIAGADGAALAAQALTLVQDFEDAIAWIKAPGRFPNGVSVIYANMYEFTDGTGDTASCPAAALAGFGTPPPDPDTLADVVIGIQEEYMRIAVENGVDMIFLLEHFCGHGWKNEDPAARCYLGPNTPRWFDLSCTHPNELGHQQIADMFLAVVQE